MKCKREKKLEASSGVSFYPQENDVKTEKEYDNASHMFMNFFFFFERAPWTSHVKIKFNEARYM